MNLPGGQTTHAPRQEMPAGRYSLHLQPVGGHTGRLIRARGFSVRHAKEHLLWPVPLPAVGSDVASETVENERKWPKMTRVVNSEKTLATSGNIGKRD
jgi:hypothetical protein